MSRSTAFVSLLLLPLLTGSVACAKKKTAEAPAAAAEAVAAVRTLTLAPQRVVDLVSLPADLLPVRRATLAAEGPGVVEKVSVVEGQAVTADQLLLSVDTRALAQAVAEAEAMARQAELQFGRAQNLFERHSITKTQMLEATTNRDVTQARLAGARLQFDKSRVKAPWAGRVAAKRVEVGDYVQPGQPVIELVDVARLKVRAPARSIDVPYLTVGRAVTIRVDAFAGETFEGTVARLGTELDRDSRTLAVEVEIANPQGRLRPGLPARMEVARQTLEQALLVPLAAVIDYENEKGVYVLAGDRAARRTVTLGPLVGEQVVITSGLAAGERVIVEGAQQVSDGQRVEEGSGSQGSDGNDGSQAR